MDIYDLQWSIKTPLGGGVKAKKLVAAFIVLAFALTICSSVVSSNEYSSAETTNYSTESEVLDFISAPSQSIATLNNYKTSGSANSTWEVTSTNNKLTLNGVNFSSTASTAMSFNKVEIVVNGTNTISVSNSEGPIALSGSTSIYISGSGTLNITVTGDASAIAIFSPYVQIKGDVTVNINSAGMGIYDSSALSMYVEDVHLNIVSAGYGIYSVNGVSFYGTNLNIKSDGGCFYSTRAPEFHNMNVKCGTSTTVEPTGDFDATKYLDYKWVKAENTNDNKSTAAAGGIVILLIIVAIGGFIGYRFYKKKHA